MNQEGQKERKITAKEAAKNNAVSAKTIIRWAEAGMRHWKLDRKYMFLQSDIDTWMDRLFLRNGNVHELPQRTAANGGR